MTSKADRAAAARRVLQRTRTGRWLMSGYLVLSAVVMMAAALYDAAAQLEVAVLVTAALGCALAICVGIANRRARQPLRAHWPELARAPDPRSMQPGAGGCLFVAMLFTLAAFAVVVAVVYGAATASATTEVTVVACNHPHRGQEQICTAHWPADGRTYHGDITWASNDTVGTTVAGRYDPAHPDVVYNASLPYLNGASVMAGTLFVILTPLLIYGYRRYRRECRDPYLAALSRAARVPPAEAR